MNVLGCVHLVGFEERRRMEWKHVKQDHFIERRYCAVEDKRPLNYSIIYKAGEPA